MNKNLLIIFTRNPELGKCKTRLAKTIGDQNALNVYKMLLQKTVSVTEHLPCNKAVYYSVKVRENDIWNGMHYSKHQQIGDDLGNRMQHAFEKGFKDGYEKILIIGSDLYDLTEDIIEEGFRALEDHDAVIGPATDGGYYLLGMKTLITPVFKNKQWGTATVRHDTLEDLKDKNTKLLTPLNDIDLYEDIKDYEVFKPFLNA